MTAPAREEEWAQWMCAAISGDAPAYRRFLDAVAPVLRGLVRRNFTRAGLGNIDVEDVVQEVLLAIHLKRHTWDQARPIGPWITAIARNKVIDALRRRGRRVEVPIEAVIETLAAADNPDTGTAGDVTKVLDRLNERQRDIVKSISIEGVSVRQTAERLDMTEVAVRVALHRALKVLASLYRSDAS